MSSYKGYISLRLPMNFLLRKLGVEDPWDCEEYIKKKSPGRLFKALLAVLVRKLAHLFLTLA